MKLKFFRQNFEKKKKTQISNFMKIHPVGAELSHADGQTDTRTLTVAFHVFANVPKTW